MFSVGELVMYGQIGVCRIQEIAVPSFCDPGENRQYYVLEPLHQNGTVFVPVDAKVSIRRVINKQEADRLIDLIPTMARQDFDGASLQELKQHYADALRSQDCGDLIELIISIYDKKQRRIQNNQKVGSIDEDAMRRAEELLYSELAVALDLPGDQVQKYIAARVKGMPARA